MYQTKSTKVVLVGAGFVGSSYAYSMVNQGLVEEFVIIDVNKEKAIGEAMDLSHGNPYSPSNTRVTAGDYSDCKDADIIVITAGAAQKPGQTRLDLCAINASIMKTIVTNVMEAGFDGVFLVASNPVDIMTYAVWKFSGLPKERVIGSGTTLDSARFRQGLAEYFNVSPASVHAYILGEHGDSSLPIWSTANIAQKPVLDIIKENPDRYSFEDVQNIFIEARDAAYHIIERKGATYYGIGMALARLTKAILTDENIVLTVSAFLEGEYKNEGLFIPVPAVINGSGVREVITLQLTGTEQEEFNQSAKTIRENMIAVDNLA